METISDFLHASGITEQELILDGAIQNIRNDKFKGWYVGNSYEGGKRRITLENWKSRGKVTISEGFNPSDPTEKAEAQKHAIEAEAKKLALQIAKKPIVQRTLAKYRAENWPMASAYLTKKKITDTFGAILIESPTLGTDLIIPMQDEHGEIWNYQTIQESGFKTYVPGGLVDGLWFELQAPVNDKCTGDIFICEGFATACSVQMAMPHQRVVCAFASWNLKAVAETIRKLNISSKIVIAGDDDWKLDENTGCVSGEEAALACAGVYCGPRFPTAARGRKDTDFGDLMIRHSLEVVTKQLTEALSQAQAPKKEWSETFSAMKQEETKITKQSDKAHKALVTKLHSHGVITPYINGVQPLDMPTNKQGMPILPPEFTAADALAKYYEGRAVMSEGSIFLYDKNFWKEVQDDEERHMRVSIQVLYGGLASNSKVNATFEQFKNILPKAPRNLFEPRHNIANFLNGTLHVDEVKKETRFAAHDPLNFCTNIIHIEYDKTRKIRNLEFEAMVGRIFGDSIDGQEKVRAVKQMYGACVAPFSANLFMLHGPAASGKTSLIIPAMNLIHKDNWSSVEPHEFEGFKMESMAGKLVNIVTDIDLSQPIKDNHIKKIEDKRPIRIDRKFKNALMAPLPYVHIFGGNDIPPTFEKSSGAHARRWTFLHVEGFKAQGQYSKNFANEVFEANPVGVLNFALDGLDDLLANNGHYFVPASGRAKMEKWQRVHDSVAQFFHEIKDGDDFGLRFEKDARIDRSYLWAMFVGWYQDSYNARPKLGRNKFFDAVEQQQFSGHKLQLIKSNGVWQFDGVQKTERLPPWDMAKLRVSGRD